MAGCASSSALRNAEVISPWALSQKVNEQACVGCGQGVSGCANALLFVEQAGVALAKVGAARGRIDALHLEVVL